MSVNGRSSAASKPRIDGCQDENVFRVPRVPAKTPSGREQSASESSKAKSPGTIARDSKKDAMLRKLAERNSQRKTKGLRTPLQPRINLDETERTFLNEAEDGQSTPQNDRARPSFADISAIHPRGGQEEFVASTPRPPSRSNAVPDERLLLSSRRGSVVSRPDSPTHVILRKQLPESSFVHDEHLSNDEQMMKQMAALSVWCNMMISTESDVLEVDFEKARGEANKALHDALKKSAPEAVDAKKPFKYGDFLAKQNRDTLRNKASKFFSQSTVPELLAAAVNNGHIYVRDNVEIFGNIALQTELLQLLLTFHPFWLHIGLETVYNEVITVVPGESFARIVCRFIAQRLFSDPKLLKNKKFAQGTVRLILTKPGTVAIHRHFLRNMCAFLYFVEAAKTSDLFQHNPRLFVRNSPNKSLKDVFCTLSRLVTSGLTMEKAFLKAGYKPTYQQSFYDDYDMVVRDFASISDGVVLARLVEVVLGMKFGQLLSTIRNPGGDRLRKIGNVKAVLEAANKCNLPLDFNDPKNVAAKVVGVDRETVLGILWRLVGVYVSSTEEHDLRRESLVLCNRKGSMMTALGGDMKGEQLVLHICQQIGEHVGVQVESLNELYDGVLLAAAWRMYNHTATDIHFFAGETLYMQVVNAAESELGVMFGLHRSVTLFAHQYLHRLFNLGALHRAASRIQRAYRSYRLMKYLKHEVANRRATMTDDDDVRRATFVVDAAAANVSAVSQAESTEETSAVMGTSSPVAVEEENTLVPEVEVTVNKEETKEDDLDVDETQMESLKEDTQIGEDQDAPLPVEIASVKVDEGITSTPDTLVGDDQEDAPPLPVAPTEDDPAKTDEVVTSTAPVSSMESVTFESTQVGTPTTTAVVVEENSEEQVSTTFESTQVGSPPTSAAVVVEEKTIEEVPPTSAEDMAVDDDTMPDAAVDDGTMPDASDDGTMPDANEEGTMLDGEDDLVPWQGRVKNLVDSFEGRSSPVDGDELDHASSSWSPSRRASGASGSLCLTPLRRVSSTNGRSMELAEDLSTGEANDVERSPEVLRPIQEDILPDAVDPMPAAVDSDAMALETHSSPMMTLSPRHSSISSDIGAQIRELKIKRRASLLNESTAEWTAEQTTEKIVEEHAATVIQSHWRAALRRRATTLARECAAATKIQAFVRSFICRRRIARLKLFYSYVTDEVGEMSSVLCEAVHRPFDHDRLHEIIRRMRAIRKEQEKLTEKLAILSKRHGSGSSKASCEADEPQQRPRTYTEEDRRVAATRIQKWWRGERVRRSLTAQLAARVQHMAAYVARVEEEQQHDPANFSTDVVESVYNAKTAATRRLELAVGLLSDSRLFRVKVIGYIVYRLISLTPQLLEHFVLRADGFVAMLHRLHECDRGLGSVDIATIFSRCLALITKAAETNEKIRCHVVAPLDMQYLFQYCGRIFSAFHQHEEIVLNIAAVIVDLLRMAAAKGIDKQQFKFFNYYIKQAKSRFHRPGFEKRMEATVKIERAFGPEL